MKIFAKNIEHEALEQFRQCMADPSVFDGALMADAHTGYTLPIGGVVLNKGKIFPSYVGFDIGCGVCGAKTNLKKSDILGKEKEIFDAIYRDIPCGEGKGGSYKGQIKLPISEIGKNIFESNSNQIGTLGGGNHFIEVGYDEEETIWVIVHSGSRGFGYKLGDHYMRLAKASNLDTSKFEAQFAKKHEGVRKHNAEKYGEILQQAIEKYSMSQLKGECGGNNGFELNSKNGRDYLMDMNFALEFALLNRKIMLDKTLNILGAKQELFINKNHNCADILPDGTILHRKGATSSNKGELGIIPGNMKEGCVIVEGKGNPDFLCCSSHGAGRIMSRSKADLNIKLEDFEKDMEGITALVNESTKDESRFAYKNFSEVLDMQKDSITILHFIKPIINIKG